MLFPISRKEKTKQNFFSRKKNKTKPKNEFLPMNTDDFVRNSN